MALAFRHAESGATCIVADAEGYSEPDWEALPDVPEGEGPWELVGSEWYRDAEPAWTTLRAERDRRLAACDWTQLADVPADTRDAWQPYRQALRDMTETADPFAPEWPLPPA